MQGKSVSLYSALESIADYWTPRVVGQVNDQYIKVAKLKGDFPWHEHSDEDEMFLVLKGRLHLHLPDQVVVLDAGDFYVVPRKTMHRPYADDECAVMLIETVTTRHTGDLELPQTVPITAQLTG